MFTGMSNISLPHLRLILISYTEAERQYMSNELVSSLYGRDYTQALLDIERFECMTNEDVQFSFFEGPFGVSRFSQTLEEETINQNEETPVVPDDWILELDGIFDQADMDFESMDCVLGIPDSEGNGSPDSGNLVMQDAEDIETVFEISSPTCIEKPLTFFTHHIEAWSILSHYKDKIVPLISPLGFGQEAPWLNLVIPCATSTLTDLTADTNVTFVKLSLLNALLSTSAFHLGNHSAISFESWIEAGNTYLKRAQHCFLRCMEEICLSTKKTSKYKEVLMAILSLSTAFMIKGDSEQRLSCLVQAEKFISINGLKQPTLSPKRRALHHCYAYMRIMTETTSINATPITNPAWKTGLPNEHNFEMPYTDFRIYPNIAFTDNIMKMEKDPAVAQRDLHLAIPGRWRLTLFPKICGVAESFLMLLSQVIRLANERDLSVHGSGEGILNLRDFWARAKALEKAVRVLLASCTSPSRAEWEEESQIDFGKQPRAQVMYTALLIFFHRRVTDLDPSLLQREVESVQCLLEQVRVDEANLRGANMATLIWPAFIAACEAVHSETQTFFSLWFESCSATTGLISATIARQIIEIIWTEREMSDLDGEIVNWPDVLRAKKIRIPLNDE
ncbi:hypothetical protein N7466_009223 [Penicillium verhagenii]|uniref:uncharacterized protein n=1 Tax=Penicillium verhagenii TaxID=1562060 RepID=UPI0025450EA7|nr:uncharacterized protein N7466_009223 [Penicillium verhagenii]KAJ5920897.1 hypothetical protein N7466_009223 [Penicillium verhagenii]